MVELLGLVLLQTARSATSSHWSQPIMPRTSAGTSSFLIPAICIHIAQLESEAAADPKAFYGNKHTPADGGDRVRAALAFVASLKTRLDAINRGA